MNKQEQRQKLWCDVYVKSISNGFTTPNYSAEQAVKAFDEAFGEPTEPDGVVNGNWKVKISEHIIAKPKKHTDPTQHETVTFTREEADELYNSVMVFHNDLNGGNSRYRAKELLKIKP